MNKDEIIYLAMSIYEETMLAVSYWSILQQYPRNIDKYYEEINISSAFYQVVRQALMEGLFMNLAKIYDINSNSYTIKDLLTTSKLITVSDLNESVKENYQSNNETFKYRVPLEEECFFVEKVNHSKNRCKSMNIPYYHTTVYMSISEHIELFTKKFNALKPIIKNLIIQRNKLYAHNDKTTNFNSSGVYKQFPIDEDDVNKLINYSLDFSIFCIELLTGVSKAKNSINIEDWERTLDYVRIGFENIGRVSFEPLEYED